MSLITLHNAINVPSSAGLTSLEKLALVVLASETDGNGEVIRPLAAKVAERCCADVLDVKVAIDSLTEQGFLVPTDEDSIFFRVTLEVSHG